MKTTVIDRSAPPPSGEVHPFHFPRFVRRRLPSGVVAYAAQLPGVPLASVELLAAAGAQHDPAGREGLATLTAALLDEGAAGRSAMEIAGGVERLGGQLATGADWDSGYAGILILSRHLAAGVRLLSEVATAPTFPEAEVERLRRQRLTELLRRRHQPAAVADEQLAAAIYQGTVYAHSPLGTEAAISSLRRDEMLDFYRRRYRLPEAILIAVSDVDPETLLGEADAALAASPAVSAGAAGAAGAGEGDGAAFAAAWWPPDIRPAPLPGLRVVVADRPGAAQTELRLGHASVPRAHPDFITLAFLNTLLGGKFTSRINLNLRERHGYTYGAASRFSGRLGPGPFVVSAAVATESAGAAAREVLSELRRIRDEPVTREEMEETRSYMLGVFPYTVQGMSDVARRLADIAVYGLPDDYYERYLRTIASLSRADLQEAARRHLDPDRLAIVAVGPADPLRRQLEGLGEVAVRSGDDLAGTAAGLPGPPASKVG
ncbi:MAG TPA: pitrilysin family protein [Thermoanaerobaculia bacterium]|jgi:zinc protease|nr:pitrilysin family protein [Thermoanaerobaculia bacterium]